MGRKGNVEEALREHETLAEARPRVLGADHSDTLRSRHRLAQLVSQVHGIDAGLPLLARVVADRGRVLSPHHPYTLISRYRLVLAVAHPPR